MLNFTQTKLHVVQAGLRLITGSIPTRLRQHIRSHIDPNGAPACSHFAPGNKNIKTAATAQVEHNLAWLKSRQSGWIAAGKSHVCALGQGFEFFERVA